MRIRRKTMDTPLKRRAANDYQTSLSQFGGRLSNPIQQLCTTAADPDQIHFGVVVIGSGYGASIAAARLSQHLKDEYRICILERGKEWIPGSFPDTFAKVSQSTRQVLTGPTKGHMYNPLGIYNLMMNDEVNIMGGSGLGGGSLINASIALRPHTEVFEQSRWPMALRDVDVLGPYYDLVANAMSVGRSSLDQVPKMRVRRMAAEKVSRNPNFYDRSNISVMLDHRHLDQQMRNRQGMTQRICTMCGDCITGCNVGAKNTLTMNYLPVAKWNGTEMYTQVEVISLEKHAGYYRINLEYVDGSDDEIIRRPMSINSKMVVVGCGSPGSAMVLLQSQREGFEFSPKLGHGWSGNGDAIGFVTGLCGPTNIGGFGTFEAPYGPVGPTVQTSLNYYRDIELPRRLLVQDASLPRGVSNLFSILLRDPELRHSMVMLAMGHDTAEGRLEWDQGRWKIKWPGLKESKYRKMVFGEFEKLAIAHGGKYKRLKAFGDNLVTVHPLGACGMSDDPSVGPTNQFGQVFDGAGGGWTNPVGEPAVHHGLYVADASLIPTALGVNPYMTIGAISERVAAQMTQNPAHSDLFDTGTATRKRAG